MIGTPEHRLIRVFARFRAVGEAGVLRRVGQIQWPRVQRDVADDALAHLQPRGVDGGPVQTLGRKQFQPATGFRQIDRADLGHHVHGDHLDHLVEARLRRDALDHDLAHAL
jgi:hypothetical protein